MEKKQKDLLFFIFLLFGLCGLAGTYQNKPAIVGQKIEQRSPEPAIFPHQGQLNDYHQWLLQEEKHVWHSIERHYGISKKKCEDFGATLENRAFTPKEVSTETKKLVLEVFADFKITPTPIVSERGKGSPAEAGNKILFIDEPELRTYSRLAQKFIIGHEIRHIVHNDSPTGTALDYFLEHQRVKVNDNPTHPINRLNRFIEMRADMETALHSPEYAQGMVEAMTAFYQKHGAGRGVSHPKTTRRKEIGHTIVMAHDKTVKNTVVT